MEHLVDDNEAEYQKIWLELQAMAWNHPEMRVRVGRILGEWQAVIAPAFRDGLRELGVDTPALSRRCGGVTGDHLQRRRDPRTTSRRRFRSRRAA